MIHLITINLYRKFGIDFTNFYAFRQERILIADEASEFETFFYTKNILLRQNIQTWIAL